MECGSQLEMAARSHLLALAVLSAQGQGNARAVTIRARTDCLFEAGVSKLICVTAEVGKSARLPVASTGQDAVGQDAWVQVV